MLRYIVIIPSGGQLHIICYTLVMMAMPITIYPSVVSFPKASDFCNDILYNMISQEFSISVAAHSSIFGLCHSCLVVSAVGFSHLTLDCQNHGGQIMQNYEMFRVCNEGQIRIEFGWIPHHINPH